MSKRLLVRYGNSHRQIRRQHAAFESAGIALQSVGAFTLGSKARMGIIPNTPEAIALAKQNKMSICKKQWSHL